MADPRDLRLLSWGLGSLHAALLLVAGLLALHLDGTLGETLGGGGTLVGGGLYLVLLSSTVLTAHLLLDPSGLDERRDLPGTLATVAWGAVGGGANGLLFLFGLLAVGTLFLLVTEPTGVALLPFVFVFGSVVAVLVGVVAGVAFVLVDLVLLRVAAWLVPADRGRERL